MRKNTRKKKLLSILIDSKQFMPTKDIAKRLNVSTRTIFNDLESDEFRRMLFGATIERKSNLGIRLSAEDNQLRKISYHLYDNEFPIPENYYFSDIENILLFFLKLNSNFTTKQKLTEYLFVEINSIDYRIEQTNQYIEKYNLQISGKSGRGLEFIGEEDSKRSLFRKLILDKAYHNKSRNVESKDGRISDGLWHYLELVFGVNILQDATDLVDLSEINLNEVYTNFDYENLVVKFCVKIQRLLNHHELSSHQVYSETNREYLIALLLSNRIENTFNIKLSQNEIYELTEDIISTRRIDYNNSQLTFTHEGIVSKFTELVSAGLDVDLSHDDELKHNLTKHLIPAIHRIRHGIHVENPLLKHIKYEYTKEYIIVMTCIEEIEKSEGITFDENELGYICLHVVAAVNRASNGQSVNAVLICDSGLAISSYLSSRIEHQFKDIRVSSSISTNSIQNYDFSKYDIVINSTQMKLDSTISSIVISDIFSENDQDRLRSWLVNNKYQAFLKVEKEIKDNIFFFQDQAKTKEEVILRYSKFLMIDGYVTEGFGESCIEREKTIPTTIGRGIALPHGSEEYVLKSATLIIQLSKPILWNDQLVDLVFLLAINKMDINDFRTLVKHINTLITDEAKLLEIKNTNQGTEIKNILFSNYKED